MAKSLDYCSSRQNRPQPKLCNRQRFLLWDRHISYSASMAHEWPGSRSCRVESRSSKSTAHLPSTYTSAPPVALRENNFNVPVVQGPIRLTNFLATAAAAEKEEDGWLNLVKAAIEKQAVDNWILWPVYHANAHHTIIPPPAIHALFYLFTGCAHSTAMLCLSMDITKEAVQCLNREQIPVLTADRFFFAMLREIQ